jgi:hypothetical protein
VKTVGRIDEAKALCASVIGTDMASGEIDAGILPRSAYVPQPHELDTVVQLQMVRDCTIALVTGPASIEWPSDPQAREAMDERV